MKYSISAIIFFFFTVTAFAQPGEYPHPELKWYTAETEHFTAFYHQGTERVAKTCLKIAEEIYPPITQLYSYEPDGKIHFLIKDTDDYSNGGAYYYDNKILIWATALDWDLRGTANWLRNVVTHEFTHMIQLGASRKITRQVPGVYLQWLNYEEERRPDVLYGFPNVLMSYPVAMTVIPHWFAEGTAQNQAPGFAYDYWDSHRDMILRTRTLSGDLLTLDEMGNFGFNSIGNESVYNQGFSLVSYIRQHYGDQALQKISAGMKRLTNYSFDNAVRSAIGIGEMELYQAWKDSITSFYRQSAETIARHTVTGEKLDTPGAYANLYPAFCGPDDIIFLSNKGQDYISLTSLYRRNLKTGKIELLKSDVASRPYISPDGQYIAYSAKRRPVNRSVFYDLYIYILASEKEYRLTKGARASSPAISPDGTQIAFILNGSGSKNLALADLPALGKDKEKLIPSWKILTHYHWGEQLDNPVFSPDGKYIAFELFYDGPKDIMLCDLTSGEIIPLCASPADERNPAFSPQGSRLLYSSDVTGIFNLYTCDINSGGTQLLTNTIGGAFMGSFSTNGQIIYSGYVDDGFQLYLLNKVQPINPQFAEYKLNYSSNIPIPAYNDKSIPPYQETKYQPTFGKLFFLPRLTYDLNSFKPGFYIYSSDFMDWFTLFGGFACNGFTEDPKFFQGLARLNPKYIGDYDLFGLIEYHNIIPSLFIEGYSILRKSRQRFADEQHIIGEIQDPYGAWLPIYDQYAIDYRFSLNEVDAGLRYKFDQANTLELRGIASRYSAKLRFDDDFEFAYTYFKGKTLSLKWEADYKPPQIAGDINPRHGRKFIAEFARENNAFIDSFKVDAGMLEEVFSPYNYSRLALQWEEYKPSPLHPDHAITLRLNAAALDKNNLDDFFYLYAGGLPGMKGYSYYSLGGTKKIISTITYRFPIFKQLHRRYLQAYFHSIYLGLFFDYGDACTGDIDLDRFKKDAGVNLRAELTSFYTFPTAVTLEAAYGLDKFSVLQPGFQRTYGNEWRFYLTILFGFDLFLGENTGIRH